MFRDRKEAGIRLAGALAAYGSEDPPIRAIPRGGVEVGFHVAVGLGAPLAILVVRKLPLPGNPEGGFGAMSSTIRAGITMCRNRVVRRIMEEYRRIRQAH